MVTVNDFRESSQITTTCMRTLVGPRGPHHACCGTGHSTEKPKSEIRANLEPKPKLDGGILRQESCRPAQNELVTLQTQHQGQIVTQQEKI